MPKMRPSGFSQAGPSFPVAIASRSMRPPSSMSLVGSVRPEPGEHYGPTGGQYTGNLVFGSMGDESQPVGISGFTDSKEQQRDYVPGQPPGWTNWNEASFPAVMSSLQHLNLHSSYADEQAASQGGLQEGVSTGAGAPQQRYGAFAGHEYSADAGYAYAGPRASVSESSSEYSGRASTNPYSYGLYSGLWGANAHSGYGSDDELPSSSRVGNPASGPAAPTAYPRPQAHAASQSWGSTGYNPATVPTSFNPYARPVQPYQVQQSWDSSGYGSMSNFLAGEEGSLGTVRDPEESTYEGQKRVARGAVASKMKGKQAQRPCR